MVKHYAISDIHGMSDIYKKVCDLLKPDDIVYFLGDAGDRGYDCFYCIKAIYENPQWIYLKGNHEDFFVKGLKSVINVNPEWMMNDVHEIWRWNGGQNTEDGWIEAGANPIWIERLENLPIYTTYTNPKGITFHMTHAGFTMGYEDQLNEDELLWSRSHFRSKWDEEKYPNDICIHGHTPNEYLKKYLPYWDEMGHKIYTPGHPEAKEYCNGHKICIDNGVFYTKATVLYDLDEMVAIPLYSDSDFEW